MSSVLTIRDFNDDALAVVELPDTILCLAADGIGGKVGGRWQGQVACERAFEVLRSALKKDFANAATPDERREAIRRALVSANQDILAATENLPVEQMMVATIALAVWRSGEGMYVAGLGDVRAYLIRGDQIELLTVDHSVAQALVEKKTITPPQEAKTHRFSKVLWKYLGTKEVGDGPEVKLVSLQPQDRMLLCTKGLHEYLPDKRILGYMHQHPDAQKCADALAQTAQDAGSRGNVSCMVIDLKQP
jgi:protein phosphatase